MVLDFAGHTGERNAARDRTIVKLPRDDSEEVVPPTAAHVTAVARLLPSAYRLALLWLDWSGARVSSVEKTKVGDYDEPQRRALWVELPDVLAEAIERTLSPREDRDPEAALFGSVGADALRTAIGRACKPAGVPPFSPHDLRHRRISVLHYQGRSWAAIGAFVGQRNLAVTANTEHVHARRPRRRRGRLRGGARVAEVDEPGVPPACVHACVHATPERPDYQARSSPVWALRHRIAERKWLNGAVSGLPPVTGLHAACIPRCIPRI
jgi:integrase